MKKLLLLIVFCFMFLCSIAQNVLNSYAIEIGRWDSRIDNWAWDPAKECDIKFLLQGDIIIADDAAKSTYFTYKQTEEDDHYGVWLAVDEKKRECVVGLYFDPKISYLVVIYDQIAYRYSFTF